VVYNYAVRTYKPTTAAITYKKTELMAASSAGRLRHDNVTMTFDRLTPKPNQFIFLPRYTNDKSVAKIHQQILELSWKHSFGRMDGWKHGQRHAKHIAYAYFVGCTGLKMVLTCLIIAAYFYQITFLLN